MSGLYAFVFARSRCSSLLHCWASLRYSSRIRAFRIHLCILLCCRCIGIFSLVSLPLRPSHRRTLTLMIRSDAVYLFRHGHDPVRDPTGPCLLLSLDIRRFWQRQLFLCHHSCLESRPVRNRRGFAFRGTSRRMGGRKAGDEGQRCQTDIDIQQSIKPYPKCRFIELFVSSAAPPRDS